MGNLLESAMKKPVVSIITVVYNGESTLGRTIESVINQTFRNIEYIIVDGGSTDGTLSIIKKYSSQIAKWSSEKDKGIYDAMNKGLKIATGDIIGIINADDYYELDAIENVVKVYKSGLNIYHGSLRNIDLNGDVFINRAPKTLAKLKRGMIINHPTVFVNKEVYEDIGGFSLSYKIAADWNFILKAYIAKVNFIRIDKVLANFTLGGISGSINETYLKELSNVRKERGIYKNIDIYYYYDIFRYKILGENLYKLYLIKKKFFNE